MKLKLFYLCIVSIGLAASVDAENAGERTVVPTHADAAVILAKYSGLFDQYISEDATLNDCVGFLNRTGIYFGLMEVVNGKEFTVKDYARVMGQFHLVFSGEAEYLGGKVKLPKEIDSWERFCIMNSIAYVEGYEAMRVALGKMASKFNR